MDYNELKDKCKECGLISKFLICPKCGYVKNLEKNILKDKFYITQDKNGNIIDIK